MPTAAWEETTLGGLSEGDRRPRVLWVARYIPYIPSGGGATRSFYLVRAAAEVADVTLVGAAEDRPNAHLDVRRLSCERIHLISALPRRSLSLPLGRPLPTPVPQVLEIVRALRRRNPYVQGWYDVPTIQARVRDLLRESHYDLLVVDSNELGGILHEVGQTWAGPSMVLLYDVLHLLQRRIYSVRYRQRVRWESRKDGWQSAYRFLRLVKQGILLWAWRRTARELRATEYATLCSYTRVVTVSHVDAMHLERLLPGRSVDVIPNGVDVDYFGAVSNWPDTPIGTGSPVRTLVFTGSLSYHPNVDGLRFFMAEIWPLIRARGPDVRFLIVGQDPKPEIQALARREGVEVFASVPDVRPYLAASAVAVVPLRLGSGTRLKILEALAARRPVVSTTLGAEGLELEPGRDLLVADTAAAFAEAVMTLLEQPAYARDLAAQGCETVRRLYSWDGIVARFRALLADQTELGSL